MEGLQRLTDHFGPFLDVAFRVRAAGFEVDVENAILDRDRFAVATRATSSLTGGGKVSSAQLRAPSLEMVSGMANTSTYDPLFTVV
jgi:hypothetical protein